MGWKAALTADGKATVTWISGGGGKRYEALLTKGLHVDDRLPPIE